MSACVNEKTSLLGQRIILFSQPAGINCQNTYNSTANAGYEKGRFSQLQRCCHRHIYKSHSSTLFQWACGMSSLKRLTTSCFRTLCTTSLCITWWLEGHIHCTIRRPGHTINWLFVSSHFNLPYFTIQDNQPWKLPGVEAHRTGLYLKYCLEWSRHSNSWKNSSEHRHAQLCTASCLQIEICRSFTCLVHFVYYG